MSGTIEGKRILITRSAIDNALWSKLLVEQGAIPACVTCIETEHLHVPMALQSAVNQADWLVFGSRHAAHALDRMKIDIGQSKIACVGPATMAALTVAERKVAWHSPKGNMRDLALELEELLRHEGANFLLVIGSPTSQHSFEETLANSRHSFGRIDVYATRGVIPSLEEFEALDKDPLDYIFLTSPESVRSLASQPKLTARIPLISIGPTTTRVAREAGLKIAAESDSRGLPGIIEAANSTQK